MQFVFEALLVSEFGLSLALVGLSSGFQLSAFYLPQSCLTPVHRCWSTTPALCELLSLPTSQEEQVQLQELFFKDLFYLFLIMCVSVWVCTSECTCLWSQERALDLLVCCEPTNISAGRTELRSSSRAGDAFNHWAIATAPGLFLSGGNRVTDWQRENVCSVIKRYSPQKKHPEAGVR